MAFPEKLTQRSFFLLSSYIPKLIWPIHRPPWHLLRSRQVSSPSLRIWSFPFGFILRNSIPLSLFQLMRRLLIFSVYADPRVLIWAFENWISRGKGKILVQMVLICWGSSEFKLEFFFFLFCLSVCRFCCEEEVWRDPGSSFLLWLFFAFSLRRFSQLMNRNEVDSFFLIVNRFTILQLWLRRCFWFSAVKTTSAGFLWTREWWCYTFT